jgi:hypothetical protein
MLVGPSGFVNAPITKAIFFGTAGLSVLSSVLNWKYWLTLDQNHLQQFQLWRLATHHFIFSSLGEGFLSLLLLYQFRLFERQMGSRKFGSFAFLAFCISSLLEVAGLVVYTGRTSRSVTTSSPSLRPPLSLHGLYGLLFALMVQFWKDVPSTYKWTIRSTRFCFSDKIFNYLIGLQLLLSQPPASLISASAGLIFGVLYRVKGLGLDRFRLPDWVSRFCCKVFLPWLQSRPPLTYRTPSLPVNTQLQAQSMFNRENGNVESNVRIPLTPSSRQSHNNNNGPATRSQGHSGESPTEENINVLTSMGFTRQQATLALTQAQNDLQVAIGLLIDGS